MPQFRVDLTVLVGGYVIIDASDMEAAREASQEISALDCDVCLTGRDAGFQEDGMFPEVEVDGVEDLSFVEEEEEG